MRGRKILMASISTNDGSLYFVGRVLHAPNCVPKRLAVQYAGACVLRFAVGGEVIRKRRPRAALSSDGILVLDKMIVDHLHQRLRDSFQCCNRTSQEKLVVRTTFASRAHRNSRLAPATFSATP